MYKNASLSRVSFSESQRLLLRRYVQLVLLASFMVPMLAFAQDTSGTSSTMCTLLTNMNDILNAISLVVVTIAVIFSGYQIAFAHKRISEVAPILIGGVLIGAAGQIAKLVLGGSGGVAAAGCGGAPAAYVVHMLQHYV
jgi:type IV secretion system protein VirB2